MQKFVVFVISILTGSSALAIDLHESLSKAYDNSDQIKVTRDNFLNDIEAFPRALADFLPDISISASGTSSSTKVKNPSIIQQQNPSIQKNIQKGISVTQSLFSGGSGIAGLKAAQSGFRAARGNFYDKEQQGILAAVQAYLKCYAAREKYNISASSVNANRKQFEAAQERLKVGEATQSDVATAKASFAIAETNRLQAYAAWQGSKAQFVQVFGVEPENITLPPEPKGLPKSLDELLEKSLQLNPSVENSKHSFSTSKSQEFAAKGALAPKVDLSIQAGNSFYDNQTSINNDRSNFSSQSTLSVTMPIYSKGGASYSRIRQAKNQTRLAAIDLDNAIKTNNASCISSWEQYNAAKSSISSAQQGVEAAEIAYESITQEELLGSKTILDVLNAETQLSQSKSQKVDADTQYVLAAYQIKALLGQVTAKALKLNVKYFSPEDEFKRIKKKIIGF